GVGGSLKQAGGNLTGVSPFISVLGAKRLELLRELVPTAAEVAVLFNPKSPEAETVSRDVEAAAHAIGLQTHVLAASSESDIDAAFASLVQRRFGILSGRFLTVPHWKPKASACARGFLSFHAHRRARTGGWARRSSVGHLRPLSHGADDKSRPALRLTTGRGGALVRSAPCLLCAVG